MDLVFWAAVSSIIGAIFTVLQFFQHRHDQGYPDSSSPNRPPSRPGEAFSSPSDRDLTDTHWPKDGFYWFVAAGIPLISCLVLAFIGYIVAAEGFGMTHDDALKGALVGAGIGVIMSLMYPMDNRKMY